MRLGCALLLIGLSAPLFAADRDRTADFEIAPQPLSSALLQFSSQSGTQILAADETIASFRTPGVRGRFTIADALQRMLVGTTIEFRDAGEDTIVLLAARNRRVPNNLPRERRRDPITTSHAVPMMLDEVIVTAQRRVELLQRTPLSVTVLGRDQLEQRGITALTDLFSGAVPSLRIATFIGRTSLLTIAMRGIHSGEASQISRDAGVGIYLDGVYLGRNQGIGAELLDIERMEILRGPQGTLFGRNAVGGALNILSHKPSGTLALSQSVGVRDHGGFDVTTRLDLPRIDDLSIKIDGTHNQSDGLVRNRLESAWNYGQFKRGGVRGQALWEPGDRFSALYAYDQSEDRSAPYYLHITQPPASATLAPIFHGEPDPARRTRTAVPLDPSIGTQSGHHVTLDWHASAWLSLRSISAYRTLDQSQFDNWAGATEAYRPNRSFGRASIADMRQEQLSHELQFNGTLPRLDFVAGAYYFVERARDEASEFFSNRFNGDGTQDQIVRFDDTGIPTTRASRNYSRSRALFGQATWHPPVLDERFAATAGMRYTMDDKNGHLTTLYGAPAPPQYRYRFESSRFDPTAALEYRLHDDINVYLRWGTAYRAGGANSRSITFRSFGPEDIKSWETGIKAEWLDHRARVNAAFYDMRYNHLQVSFMNPDTPVNTETVNTDRAARLRGAEIEFALATESRLVLGGSYAYSDMRIPPRENPFTGELTRLASIFAPRHALTMEVRHDTRVGRDALLSLHADATYRSGQYTYNSDTTRSSPALIVGVRATLKDIPAFNGALSLALWCRNLFDKAYEVTGISSPNGPLTIFGEPRGFGLDATYRFARE